MQRTRLNSLLDGTGTRIDRFFENPWRRFSLILLGLLFGFFAGAGISTTAGQAAEWDIVGAGLILFFTELVSRFVYAQNRRSLFIDVLNFFKVGVIYSLFLEAFKLGS